MGGQELWDIALGKVRIMLAAENTGASSEHVLTNLVHPTDAGVGILDHLVFQLGFSRLLPYHLRWNPIFPTVPLGTRARSMLLCKLRSSLQDQPSLDAPLYLPETH